MDIGVKKISQAKWIPGPSTRGCRITHCLLVGKVKPGERLETDREARWWRR